MLQFDDSGYVDAKQYHLASFSTRNSTLNTSLRKPIRMQDVIQLCDSNSNEKSTLNRFNYITLFMRYFIHSRKLNNKTIDLLDFVNAVQQRSLIIDNVNN